MAVRRRAGDGRALLLDLGAGSGASFRALAPQIPGDQDWRLLDADQALLGFQAQEIAQWARGQGYRVALGSGAVTIAAPAADWRAHGAAFDLAGDLDALPLANAHGVTCSALLDLVTAPWLEHLADRLAARRLPFLAALSVDGRRDWQPLHDADVLMTAAFGAHQRSDKGFGAALGPDAPGIAEAAFRSHGYDVAATASDWRIDGSDTELLAAMISGAASAAAESAPDYAATIAAWRETRESELAAGKLSLTVGHIDILAAPAESR
jgi:hypothetical protein